MTAFVSETLGDNHDLGAFHSGVDALDTWLVSFARHAQAFRTARTFVWHRGNRRVVAYYSLAAHLVMRAELPGGIGRGSPDVIPSILLARLALDASLHGEGLGGELLIDALRRATAASDIAAARLIVVDAINDSATAVYQHHGFRPIPGNPSRLVQKISDVAKALAS